MPARLRLLEEWNSYVKAVFTDGRPGAIQLQETRRAFYAGGLSVFKGIVMQGLSAGPDPQPSDLLMLDELDKELKQFYRDVAEGRA